MDIAAFGKRNHLDLLLKKKSYALFSEKKISLRCKQEELNDYNIEFLVG
jgi:hypothetical protein